jgi:hypothetical protein
MPSIGMLDVTTEVTNGTENENAYKFLNDDNART